MKYNGIDPFEIEDNVNVAQHNVMSAQKLLRLTANYSHDNCDDTIIALIQGAIAALEIATDEIDAIDSAINEAIEQGRKAPDDIVKTTTEERPFAGIGGRAKTLFKIADELAANGLSENDIAHKLAEVNEIRFSPPLSDKEVRVIARGSFQKANKAGGSTHE